MHHGLLVITALVSVASAQAQVRPLQAPFAYVCTPEGQQPPKCSRGDLGLALLAGPQLKFVQNLLALSSRSAESDVQKLVGNAPRSVADPGTTAYLDGRPIRRRSLMWSFPNAESSEPMDTTVLATFANDQLMNVQLGGVKIPRSSVYYSAMECEPNCAGRLTPQPSPKK